MRFGHQDGSGRWSFVCYPPCVREDSEDMSYFGEAPKPCCWQCPQQPAPRTLGQAGGLDPGCELMLGGN